MVKEGPANQKMQGKEPELVAFIDFVNDENLIVNEPVFSKEAVEQYITRKQNQEGLQNIYQDQRKNLLI